LLPLRPDRATGRLFAAVEARRVNTPRSSARPLRTRRRSAAAVLTATLLAGCALDFHSKVPSPPPGSVDVAALWVEPRDLEGRDLFYGVGGKELAPSPDEVFRFESEKDDFTAFSPGLDVEDRSGLEWSVKLGAEVHAEVLASRILWAVGYHQPPVYHLARWRLERDGAVTEQPSARFRPKLDEMKREGNWSWHDNPFEGTQAFRGLLVMMVFLNNWDLTVDNTSIYDLAEEREGARRWYLVRDVGASFSRNRGPLIQGTRGDIAGYEEQGFIRGVSDGRVELDWNGPHASLFEDLTPADVRWTMKLLARITPRQWADAFRAAGYGPADQARLQAVFDRRIAEGKALG
jgi:hypothetical protein